MKILFVCQYFYPEVFRGTTSRSPGQRMDMRCMWFVGCQTTRTGCSIRDIDGSSVVMRG